jgi:hypothetical protein
MALPLGLMTVIGPAWLGPGAEQSRWVVPLAATVLTIPFYMMSVLSEYFIVKWSMPSLSRQTVRSSMLGANATSYALLLLGTLMGWVRPQPFEKMSMTIFPVTAWLVETVLRLAGAFYGQ